MFVNQFGPSNGLEFHGARALALKGAVQGYRFFARLSFDLLMRLLELFVSGLFDVGDVIVGVFHRQNELRQFDLESLCVVVLRVLNKKDHEEVTIVVPVLMTSCQVSL